MSDPFSKDDLRIDPEEFDMSQAVTDEQFITVSHKMMAWDIGHSFTHWAEVDLDKAVFDDEDRELFEAMVLHLESIQTGAQMVIERLIEKLSPDQRAVIMCRKLEAVHGVPFEARPFYDDEGNVIGHGFKAASAEIDMEELKTWLDQAGPPGE